MAHIHNKRAPGQFFYYYFWQRSRYTLSETTGKQKTNRNNNIEIRKANRHMKIKVHIEKSRQF